jgi:2-haloacid dehalogenase
MIDFSKLEFLTFDCYGTLIDWETGILSVLHRTMLAHSISLPDAEILRLYGDFEAEAEQSPYREYREVLRSVVRSYGMQFSFSPTNEEVEALPDSLPKWLPWPDTVSALQKLQTRYKLAVISNIDDDLFRLTQRNLSVTFQSVTTAMQARCYKPALDIFSLALGRTGSSPEKVLHVGQSIYHDVLPAKSLGMPTVWVNRPSRRDGVGAVKKVGGTPDMEVRNLETLARVALG